MTIKASQTNPPQDEELVKIAVPSQAGNESDSPTPDSYDPNIIPAETAARMEREGENYKQLPNHPPGSESLDTTGGFTVDKEGLVDNFGIEPEMYYEQPGDIPEQDSK